MLVGHVGVDRQRFIGCDRCHKWGGHQLNRGSGRNGDALRAAHDAETSRDVVDTCDGRRE